MGLEASGCLDVGALRDRISGMEETLRDGRHEPARVAGRAPHPRHRPPDRARTRSRPTPRSRHRGARGRRDPARRPAPGRACPTGPTVDGERILTTRQAYPPPEIPEHLVVIGSGVTGVEFTHMFSALGSQVTLIVSRQQVLPYKDPEVAAVLENEFLRRGVKLLKGARAIVDRARGRQGLHRVRRRSRRRRLARAAVRSARSRTAKASAAKRPASRSTRTATSRATATARRTCRTSTPPATSRVGCRCRRSRRCRAARSPST